MLTQTGMLLAADEGFIPEVTMQRLIGLLVLALGAVLIWGAVRTIGASKGTNTRGATTFVIVAILCMIPVAMYVGGVLTFADSIGNFGGF